MYTEILHSIWINFKVQVTLYCIQMTPCEQVLWLQWEETGKQEYSEVIIMFKEKGQG